jgi:hypothetical protein
MSNSRTKYDELVEDGKIQPVKLSDTVFTTKQKNVMDIIQLCRTVSKHELDFEIANSAIILLGRHPEMSEVQAIKIAMSKLNI